jgi:hypothetical protein
MLPPKALHLEIDATHSVDWGPIPGGRIASRQPQDPEVEPPSPALASISRFAAVLRPLELRRAA